MPQTVHGRPLLPVLGALLLAALSFALLQTMVAPALPAITKDYETTASTSTWVMTGFLLSASVCTPLAGKLGDLFGKARVLTVILVVFTLGSLICAAADTIGVLIAGRIVSGVAGGVFPLAFGIINDEVPPERRGMSIGLMSAMFGIGGGIGMPLAGVIVDNADLSWLFLVGLLAAPAAVAVWKLVPPSPPRERTRVDWLGAGVLSAALAAILLGVSKANDWGWTSAAVLGLIGAGVVLLIAFARIESATAQPLIEIRLLRERAVASTNIAAFLTGFAMFGSFLLIPLFAQTPARAGYGFAMTVTEAGLVMLPSAIAMLFAGPIGGILGSRIGFRSVLMLGTLLAAASFAMLSVLHGEVWEFIVAGLLQGFGISFAFAAMANLIVAAVPPRDVGIATGINTVARTTGGAFGTALVTALVTAETIPGTAIPTEDSYTLAFAVSAVGVLLALAAAARIPSHPGENSVLTGMGTGRGRTEVAQASAGR